ncbi:hypothetical protein BpHYR1_041570 [Brachionus plicatilis]|uniref:Uncharacterized protein n=1 Tax=Brachionus plicatilis TaxID=10195 RepID=A0A3M7SRJ3_BRAPC|nr:hypothetical protein BpHYR1_041570 [Brachionus plicatilis]
MALSNKTPFDTVSIKKLKEKLDILNKFLNFIIPESLSSELHELSSKTSIYSCMSETQFFQPFGPREGQKVEKTVCHMQFLNFGLGDTEYSGVTVITFFIFKEKKNCNYRNTTVGVETKTLVKFYSKEDWGVSVWYLLSKNFIFIIQILLNSKISNKVHDQID